MKKWKIIRDTLGFFGISKSDAKEYGVKPVSMDDDITVHYITSGGTEFSGNIITETHSINDDVLVPGVPGEIIIGDGSAELYISSGNTQSFTITDEEGNTIADADFTVTSSNLTNVSVVANNGIDVTGNIALKEATITVKLVADTSVVSKLKVYVIE